MRRSAAPSKTGKDSPLLKRVKFTPPTQNPTITSFSGVVPYQNRNNEPPNNSFEPTNSQFSLRNVSSPPSLFRNVIQSNEKPQIGVKLQDKSRTHFDIVEGKTNQITGLNHAHPQQNHNSHVFIDSNVPYHDGNDSDTSSASTRNGRNSHTQSHSSFSSFKDIENGRNFETLSSAMQGDTSCNNIDSSAISSSAGDAIPKKKFQSLVSNKKTSSYVKTPFGLTNQQNNHLERANPDAKPPACKYLSVVWCKMSKKKHKKWEGDAVLVAQGRTASLYDMEGKVIGKGTGYKVAELESLKEDETLFVGGKEIQVMSEFSEEHFKSGKCFSSGVTLAEPDSLKVEQKSLAASKPFSNPLLKGGPTFRGMAKKSVSSTLRFDPTSPGAVVMLRPGPDHQWKHNKQGEAITDVVVDPYLSSCLRPHQTQGVAFLYECVMGLRDFAGHGAVLADDMGLGKTLQCISLIWTLLKQGPYGGKPVAKKVIVITPGSLVKNWFQEFKKWLGSERLSVYAVSADKKVQDFIRSGQYPVLIISYEMFVRTYDDLKTLPFDLVICDEGHRLKNTAIKTTSLIMSLPSRRRVVLTGTPVQNDLQEFFSIVEFCNPGVLGSSAAFRRVYEEPIVASRQPEACHVTRELGAERAAELSRLTHMFVLRRTQEVNNQYLPPKVELVLFCRPSSLQLTLYKQLSRSNLIRRCLSGNLSGSPHLICIGALKNLCNHPGLTYCKAAEANIARQGQGDGCVEDTIYDDLLPSFPSSFDPDTVSTSESGKLEVLSQILSSIWKHSTTEKVVLVSNHTKSLDFLQVFCDLQGYTYLRLDGQTPTGQRQEMVNRFNNRHSNHRIFLLSSKAGGVGLNLIGASRLILYDIDWNPANDLQAMARVWRDGQTKKVHIYRLLTVGTIEEKIYQRQVTKQGLSGTVMDMCSKNNVMFSLEDLKDLFTLNEATDCETHAMLECSCEGDPHYQGPQANEGVQGSDASRACQLSNAAPAQSKTSNLTMAELLQWKHWRGDYARQMESWYLEETSSAVSYVFWHEINKLDNTV